MVKCKYCGSVLEINAKFCPNCGGKAEIDQMDFFKKEYKKITSDSARSDLIAEFVIPDDYDDLKEFINFAELHMDNPMISEELKKMWYLKYNKAMEKAKKYSVKRSITGFEKKRRARIILISIATAVLALLIVIGIGAGVKSNLDKKAAHRAQIQEYIAMGYIQVGTSSKDLKKMSYKQAKLTLEGRGFTNVTTVNLHDLITGFVTKKYSIKMITIDGDTSFSKSDYFAPDALVVISYHDF